MGTVKRYDLVVLGATGFTGQRIAAEIVASEFTGYGPLPCYGT